MDRYHDQSRTRTITLRKGEKVFRFEAEILKDCPLLDEHVRKRVQNDIAALLRQSWGDCGSQLIEHIVNNAKWLLVLRLKDKVAGVSVVHKKRIVQKTVYDIELTALLPEIRALRLMERINALLFPSIFLDNLVSNRRLTVEMMFTTPNPKVLGCAARIASFIYPDPFLFNKEKKKLPPPDEETWQMAQEFISQELPENMRLHKDGCVVDGSYTDRPWLIYKEDEVPWHWDERVNDFCDAYLRYEEELGRKFVVRTKLTPKSVLLYLLRCFARNTRQSTV